MGRLQHCYVQLLNILTAALLECKAETQTLCKHVNSSSVTSTQGDNMSISCLTTTHQPESLIVKLHRTNTDKEILKYPDPDSPPASQHQRWSVRNDAGNVILDLKNITLSDTGHYKCDVYNTEKDCLTTQFTLRVKECKVLHPVCAKPNSTAKLSCSNHPNVGNMWEVIQGDKSMPILKFKPHKQSDTEKDPDPFYMRAKERNGSLFILSVLNSDESWYRCRVNPTSCYEVKLQVKDCEASRSTTVLETFSTASIAAVLPDAPASLPTSHIAAVTANVATAAVASVVSVCVIISLITCVILYLKKRNKPTSQIQLSRNSLYVSQSVYYSKILDGLEFPLYNLAENPGTMTTFGAEQTEANACRFVNQPATKCSS